MSATRTIDSCEVCGRRDLIRLLDLGAQPMCDDLVPIGSNARPPVYPLSLVGCPDCITVHQQVQVEKELLFPRSYHYRARLTQDVLRGMHELVERVGRLVPLEGAHVLDVGCNDGSLLSLFRAAGARTAGVEPTGAAADALDRADWVYEGFFDDGAVAAYLASHSRPDVITFTNVFAHIQDLPALLSRLKSLIGPKTLVVIENHYLGSVVDRMQFDTFYHEHPRTYSLRSFEFIAAALDRTVETVEFPERYNGNIRVVIGAGTAAARPALDESGYLRGVIGMAPKIEAARARLRGKLAPLIARYGPLPAKAFPGRASILVHCFGLDEMMVDATYERSASPKIGHYVPGTRIEIRDEAEFLARRLGAPALVNFAWHIQPEIESYMRGLGYGGEIIPVLE